MDRFKLTFVIICAISFCLCEIDITKKAKLVNGFVDFYNRLPNEIYTCDEGFLQNAQQTDISNAYDIVVSLKVSETHNPDIVKYLICTATVADLEDGVAVMKHQCQDDPDPARNPTNIEEEVVTDGNVVTEADFVRRPIQLDNEVQTDTAVTSGEQFIAIPREEPKVQCIGCSSHVNPQAQGVSELADIGVRQLNSLEPGVQHVLTSVVDVERQVQVVNGVRYILTLLIEYNSCSSEQTDSCVISKGCKVTILEKPWMKLPDGSKYRAILSNNCTQEWRFGDDGVVPPSDNNENNNINPNRDGESDIIKVVHNVDVQSQQQTEKTMTDQDVKNLEEQIIPLTQFSIEPTLAKTPSTTPLTPEGSKEHVVKIETENQQTPNSIQTTKPQKVENLDDDKKKAIDELLNYFDLAGYDTNRNIDQTGIRMKRSFENDLNTLNIAQKFQRIKKNIENAKHIYTLAQSVVDYLNEMDLEVKHRVLKDVINAEVESENNNNFYYIQFRTIVPCKLRQCKVKDSVIKICNAVVDNTDKVPQILNVFCHDEDTKNHLGKMNSVSSDDPVLLKLVQESINKIEAESNTGKATKLNQIIDASTQRVSGTLTKISILLDQTDCDKSIPFKLRANCSVVEEYGSQICDVTIHERHWLKEKSITYSCTERPIDVRFSIKSKDAIAKSPTDSVVLDMIQEALRNLEIQSKRNNKQIMVKINSVSTQLVAGFLTHIEFVVGFTSCPTNVNIKESAECKLLENEPLKTCTAKVWDRSWIENGRQIEVSCKVPVIESNESAIKLKLNSFETVSKQDLKNINARTKRSLAGGQVTQNPSDPKYKTLAQQSLEKFLKDTGNSQPYLVVKVVKVSTQVVAGTLTRIDFEISPTDSTSGGVRNCHSEIWERPWLNLTEISNLSCEIDNAKTRTKRDSSDSSLPVERVKRNIITGGFVEQDPTKLQYRKLAEISLQKYLQNSAISQPHEVIKVENAFTQVVSGLRTVISFKIAPLASISGDVLTCVSDIWQKPWEKMMKITVNCKLDNDITKDDVKTVNEIRSKRNILDRKKVGAPLPEDPSKQEFRVLAEEAFGKYQKKNKQAKDYEVVEVKTVTSQIVSGTVYNIDYTVAHKSCSNNVSECGDENPLLHCHSKTKQVPWLLQNDIEVSCKTIRKRNKRKTNLKDAENNNKLNQLTELEILNLDERGKRQAGLDDDYIDDDIKFYYADRAIQQLNAQLRSKNLYKIITVHTVQSSMHMDNTPMVRIYFEAAETYCLRGSDDTKLAECEEMDASNHKLCLARIWPSPDDEMVIQQASVVCDNDVSFESVTGLSLASILKAAIKSVEQSSRHKYKLVHIGEPQLIPSLRSDSPMKLNFIVGTTNCSINVDNLYKNKCFMDTTIPSKACSSFVWLAPNSRSIARLTSSCAPTQVRLRRSISLDPTNATVDDLVIQKMIKESLEKLEMSSTERYKQKVLKINNCTSKVTSGKVTTIDFDVAFTSCLKYESVDDINTCGVLEHLPRRHCVAEVWERLWLNNGRNIEVSCEDEVVPLETHVEFQSAATAMALANRALKYIEAKYPHPRKQKVIRIYSLEKQVVAGVHYRMKMEVGLTNCSALSGDRYCVYDKKAGGEKKFCRVNVWLRPWTDHPPNLRVSCDYQEGAMANMFHQIQAEHLFRDFLATYSKNYVNDHEEVIKRFEIFKANINRIHELNTHERGTATYGVTQFADLTYEEFSKKHMGLKPSLRNENQVPMLKAEIPNVDVPEAFDWRDHGAVTEVKDQGSCGSCWAFSVTGNIEGQWKLKTGNLVSLSEQELVDCDKMDDGCNGGLPDNAYRAIEQLGGLELESDYPYEGEDDKCAFNKSLARVQITSALNITTNETDMAKWLLNNGPISIGINANAMQFYMGGVSHPWKMLCNPKNLDHGVLIVGYGVKDYPLFHKRLPYWIVKNSWGPSWGEQGYYRVFRGDGTCGVNQMASSAVI